MSARKKFQFCGGEVIARSLQYRFSISSSGGAATHSPETTQTWKYLTNETLGEPQSGVTFGAEKPSKVGVGERKSFGPFLGGGGKVKKMDLLTINVLGVGVGEGTV